MGLFKKIIQKIEQKMDASDEKFFREAEANAQREMQNFHSNNPNSFFGTTRHADGTSTVRVLGSNGVINEFQGIPQGSEDIVIRNMGGRRF